MELRTRFPLKTLNTFQVDAHAACYVRFDADSEIAAFFRRPALVQQPHLILGGGSNLLFVRDFEGTIFHPVFKGIEVLEDDGEIVRVRAMAGEVWDDLVAFTVERGWGGLENLAFIPGSVGASAVQNIGAYGVEVGDRIECVEAVAIADGVKIHFDPRDCGFGYRYSNFKGPWAGRFIVTAVVFRLYRRSCFVLDYPGVRSAVEASGPVNLANVRRAIIAIRQRKLPDPAVIGNAGSFFKNPVVDEKTFGRLLDQYPDLPHYPQTDGRLKLAAGWLIEQCGWKGKRLGRAAVHDKQALVLVNLGGAAGGEILELSVQVNRSVGERFGIVLEREVMVVD